MKKFYSRGRNVVIKAGLPSLNANKDNSVAIYYWQPGYSIHEKVKFPNGEIKKIKTFKPTSSLEIAISFLTSYYGPKEFIKHKGDLHPGHVSLAVKENYLSIGTADDMQDVFLTSQHLLAFTGDLIQEIDGFQRVPYAVDLHTLDTEKMISYISDFKKSPGAYTVLGRRFNISEGESCATIVHESLLQGGFSQLMNSIPRQILSENTILTPTSLKDHCEIARSVEHSLYPDAKKLSTEFQSKFKEDMQVFEKEFNHGCTSSTSDYTSPSSKN